MNPLRIAVVGAGHLGRIHARIAAGLDEIELVAVVDPVEEARQRVAQEANSRPVADYRELIGEIDAAIVATPTFTHHAVGTELLASGLPLLIEKPLTPSTSEANDLVALARRQGLVLQVGHVERFNPALDCVKREIRDPKYIEATRTSGYTFRSLDIGVVMDMMIHDIDLVLSLARSTVTSVDAMGISVLGGHEDMATTRLQFESGCVAQLTASRVSYELRRTMNVVTSRSYATVNFATHEATLVKPREDVLRREFQIDRLSADDRDYFKEHLFDELLVRTDHKATAVNAIEEEQRDFAAAIRTGSTPRVDGHAGREAVAVAELILSKIDEHTWDGNSSARQGPFAMPALPIVQGPPIWQTDDMPKRKAG